MSRARRPPGPVPGPEPPSGPTGRAGRGAASAAGRPLPDPGLQPERTRLAWRRTGFSVTVVAVLALRIALASDLAGALLAALTVLASGGLLLLCWWRGTGTGPARSGGRTLPLAGVGTAALALLAVLVVLRGVW
ncbi:DUF202 domain-containing protein [Micromonospora sp. NPDC094482]|uniref:DUF202 domain-containing protein n=1 Tax=unclassified Micromonospora TaxID=2617518 RepID=UPI0033192F9D